MRKDYEELINELKETISNTEESYVLSDLNLTKKIYEFQKMLLDKIDNKLREEQELISNNIEFFENNDETRLELLSFMRDYMELYANAEKIIDDFGVRIAAIAGRSALNEMNKMPDDVNHEISKFLSPKDAASLILINDRTFFSVVRVLDNQEGIKDIEEELNNKQIKKSQTR